jgi:hypothetical protein
MDYDQDKVDDAALALLFLTMHDGGARAWKGLDWDVLDRLHQKRYIDNPRSKAKSVLFTQEGADRSEALFKRLFGKED